jgi:hypothetical protein
MRRLLLVLLILLAVSVTFAPAMACFVTAGGTLGRPVTDVFGGIATENKAAVRYGTWTHVVPGEFVFKGKVDDISCYAPDEALLSGMGDYNGIRAWFSVRVKEGETDHYHFHIYLYPWPVTTLYETEGDLSGGSITIHTENNGHCLYPSL